MAALSRVQRRLAGIFVAVLVAVAFPGPATRAVAQTADLIRVGSGPDDQATPLLYGVKAGIYKKYGLNVEVVKLAGAAAVAAALSGGSLEIGKGSTLGVVTAISRGLPFTVIGNISYYDSDKPDIAILVPTASPIKTAKDLEGKTMSAVSLSDLNSIATFSWLDRAGVDRASIKYVELPASAALAAMEQGRIVGSTIYEPYLSSYLASGKVRVLAYPYEAVGRKFSNALLFTTSKWAAEHRDALDKFLRATEEASTYIGTHDSISTQLIAEFGGLDPATLGNMRHAKRGVALNASDVQPIIDLAAKYGVIAKAFPAKDMICSCALLQR
jgi:NitT/TauT family transport system substrate-binding protein